MTDIPGYTIDVGEFRLNLLTHQLDRGGGLVQLSPLASRFLQELAAHRGAVVERAALIDTLWRGDYLTGDPALNRVVSETRRAVGDDPRNPALIQTVHRQGYRLVRADGAAEGNDGRPWGVQAPNRGSTLKGLLWLAALILIIAGGKVLMDAMMGVLWLANNPG